MSAPVPPIPAEQNNPPAQPPTPPAPPTSPPPTDNSAQLGLYERLLQETQAENARLRAQLQAPVNPTPPAQVDAANFFQDPSGALNNFRNVLMQDVTNAIKPLNDFRTQVQQQNIYAANKLQVEQYIPNHLKAYWPLASQQIDRLAMNGQLQDVSVQAIFNLFTAFVGNMVASGQLPVPQTPTPPNPTNQFVPPSIPPSPPPPPTPSDPNNRPLTENEKMVARAAGMTDAAYLQYIVEQSMIVPPKGAK